MGFGFSWLGQGEGRALLTSQHLSVEDFEPNQSMGSPQSTPVVSHHAAEGCRRLRHRWSKEETSGLLAGIWHQAAFPAEGRQVGRWKRCPLPAPGCPRCPHSPRGHPRTHRMPEPCPGSSPSSFFIPHGPKSILFLLMHLNPKTAFGHPKEHSRGRRGEVMDVCLRT